MPSNGEEKVRKNVTKTQRENIFPSQLFSSAFYLLLFVVDFNYILWLAAYVQQTIIKQGANTQNF